MWSNPIIHFSSKVLFYMWNYLSFTCNYNVHRLNIFIYNKQYYLNVDHILHLLVFHMVHV